MTGKPVTSREYIKFLSMKATNGNRKYLIAVVSMFIFGVSGIVLISTLSPKQDLIIVISAVFALLSPTTLSLLSFMKAQETHLSVNSRLDEFIKNADLAARAEGEIEGARKANQRADKLVGLT